MIVWFEKKHAKQTFYSSLKVLTGIKAFVFDAQFFVFASPDSFAELAQKEPNIKLIDPSKILFETKATLPEDLISLIIDFTDSAVTHAQKVSAQNHQLLKELRHSVERLASIETVFNSYPIDTHYTSFDNLVSVASKRHLTCSRSMVEYDGKSFEVDELQIFLPDGVINPNLITIVTSEKSELKGSLPIRLSSADSICDTANWIIESLPIKLRCPPQRSSYNPSIISIDLSQLENGAKLFFELSPVRYPRAEVKIGDSILKYGLTMAVQSLAYGFLSFEIPGFQSPSLSIADRRLVFLTPTDEKHHPDITTDQAHGIEQNSLEIEIHERQTLLLRLDAPVSSATIFSCRIDSKETNNEAKVRSILVCEEDIKTFLKAELFKHHEPSVGLIRKGWSMHPIPATHSKSEFLLMEIEAMSYPTTIYISRGLAR